MWDVLKWQNDTLSIAWWALIAFVVLVIIAVAGPRGGSPPGRIRSSWVPDGVPQPPTAPPIPHG
jgi:hypothetical protein